MEDLKSLLQRAQNGDLSAYGTIVQRFQDIAVGYAYSIIGNFHFAEDAAQEAFIEAYSNLGKVYGPAAFPGWLRKMIFKQCDRIMRRNQKEIVGLEAAVGLPSKAIGPDEAIVQKEKAEFRYVSVVFNDFRISLTLKTLLTCYKYHCRA